MASIFQSLPLLRKHAPQLSKEFFTCRNHRAARLSPSKRLFHPSFRPSPFFQLRYQTTQVPRHASIPLSISSAGPGVVAKSKAKFFPETSDNRVAYWLLGSAASVFGIVIFGGLTRLTESGLSITEWRPVTGSLPPMNAEQWDLEFQRYRASPEFKLLNPRMTLSEFKKIYYMEWTHRLWGRIVGITFLAPTIYFIARRKVPAHMAAKLVGICGLIGCQGVIGWWMVKSGLKDDLFAPGSHPRVSQYRLATHLGAAFIVYISMLWNGLSILRENALLRDPSKASALVKALNTAPLRKFKVLTTALFALVFTTAMSGALVAGLDAGLIYNEFPWMGLGLTPPAKELFDPFYSHIPDQSDLWWRNALENPSLVQLDHRILATTTFAAICALWAYPRMSPALKQALLKNASIKDVGKRLNGVLHLAILQVTLGISALIYMVPLWLGAAHQAGALALLTGMVVLGSKLRVSPRTMRLLTKQLKAGGQGVFGSSPAVLEKGVGKAAGSLEQKVV